MELKRASLILNTPPVTPRNSLLLSAPHSAGPTGGHHGTGGERMFDLQEFLARESGNIRQSITEVDETEQPLSSQVATEFQSQGSGISSQGLSQGLSQGMNLSQHSDARSAVELNMSANSNTNNNNDNDCNVSVDGAGLGVGESILSMEDILAEFDSGVGQTLSQYTSQRDEENRLALFPRDTSTATFQPPHIPTASNRPVSHEEPTMNLSVQHQRQHSRSFNSGLNRLTAPSDQGRSKQSLTLPKSVSTDMLSDTGTTVAGAKKSRKGKDKLQKGGGSKKKRYGGSSEALSVGDRTSRKPPSGKPKKNKLPLEPRGPLYGDSDVGLHRHSAFVDSSHLSMLTNVHHCSKEVSTGNAGEGEGGKRLSLQPFTVDDESLSLEDFVQPQLSAGAHDESVWQEYGQI